MGSRKPSSHPGFVLDLLCNLWEILLSLDCNVFIYNMKTVT